METDSPEEELLIQPAIKKAQVLKSVLPPGSDDKRAACSTRFCVKPSQLVVKPVLDACGDQRRPLLVGSLLAGTGTEMYAPVAADSQSARNCLVTERYLLLRDLWCNKWAHQNSTTAS